ncbi:hypothetical protein GCWU000341_01981 [Oribacterium sp. oral taxon 078 str. F0262]|nr:hypothetical protein GCWU000341_01981 [Oribacterium sp. oral taxon 078 str. F0262]
MYRNAKRSGRSISSEMTGLGRGSDIPEEDRNGICFLKYGAEAAEIGRK